MNLIEFLAKAKIKTFASQFSIPKGILTGNKRYEYSEGDFEYLDSYFGYTRDQSTETIKFQGEEVWKMRSQGGMSPGLEREARRCFSFLKKALRNTSADFPVRGPRQFRKGHLLYLNEWKGDLQEFEGEEKIFWLEKVIYSRTYSGGTVRKQGL